MGAPSITLLESRFLLAAAGSTGRRTWEAALHLGHFFFSEIGMKYVYGKNIVELGAGTGLLTILCAKYLGASHVLATDGSGEVIDDLQSNLHLNGLDREPAIKTAVLKWGHALIDDALSIDGDDLAFDVVVGADVVGECLHLDRAQTCHSYYVLLDSPIHVMSVQVTFPSPRSL